MADYAHRWTDREIAALEQRIKETYQEAAADVQGKLNKFIRKFKRDDKMFRKQLEDGKITQADYRDWLAGQVFQGKRWRAQLADLSATLTRYNKVASDIINDTAPGVFAMNANWAAFQIEKAGKANMGFGLYDETTVKRLIRDQPTLLPTYGIKTNKDRQWNQKLITGQITQGILQGEGLDTIAKRLTLVAEMDFGQARTHARTAMTGAQNAGRLETYGRAEQMGIKLQKEWLATLDSHTRHTHAMLDGQKKPMDEPFEVEGYKIMYPGDPSAAPEMVYNCRCTMITDIAEWPAEDAQRRDNEARDNISDMTFAKWAGWKKEVEKEERRDTIKPSAKDGGEDVRIVGRINRDMFKSISENITTDEVVITDERIVHSNGHQRAFDKYGKYAPDVLRDPDFAYRDKRPNTAVLIKRVVEEGKNMQLVLRLHVPEDNPKYKSSIISFWDISESRRENYERNKEIIYRRPET